MARPSTQVPKYSLHKATGQAVSWVNRKPRYPGKYNSPEPRTAYAALLDQLSLSVGMPVDAAPLPGDDAITINEHCLTFQTREFDRYSRSERHCFQTAIRILRQTFGETPVSTFGPLRFRSVRDAMLKGAKSESRCFKWKSSRLPHSHVL